MGSQHSRLYVCLVAPSGSGKSTVAGLLKSKFEARGRTVGVYKLAQPLYETQELIYRNCGIQVGRSQQHQGILESVATFMRAINPRSIVDHFLARVATAREDVVINDDLRDDLVDLPELKRLGFKVVKVSTSPALIEQRLDQRGDLSSVHETPLNAQIARIVPDYVVVNDGESLTTLEQSVELLLAQLLADLEAAETNEPVATALLHQTTELERTL